MIDICGLDERKKRIGKRIKEERNKLGISQTKLGELIIDELDGSEKAVPQNTISSWESGDAIPTFEKLVALSRVFRCDCGYLLCDYDQQTHDQVEMCKATGLSESSIQYLCFLNKWGITDTLQTLDILIYDNAKRSPEHHHRSILDLLHWFFSYKDEQPIKKQIFTNGAIVDFNDTDGFSSASAIVLRGSIIENSVLELVKQALLSLKHGSSIKKKGGKHG